MTNETVNDIIREIREKIKTSDGSAPVVAALMSAFIDRLDAAYKRDIQAVVDANETAMGEIAKLRKTNELLECARDLWLERAGELRRRCEALNNGGAK